MTAVPIAHLAELDERRLYLVEGCVSLFRASRTFPVILEMLSEGSVNLSTVCLVRPHSTSDAVAGDH